MRNPVNVRKNWRKTNMNMNYRTRTCELTFDTNFTFSFGSIIRCDYPEDTIKYAIQRFFIKNEQMRRDCTYESWQIRLASGKKRRPRYYKYLIPAKRLELPGSWARVILSIDASGVTVKKLDLLRNFPMVSGHSSYQPPLRLCA